MELLEPSDDVVARIRQVIEEAAGSAIADGRAELVAARLADLVERPAYDCPVVLVTPKNPEAARILVEVQDDDLWWVGVADGPGSELHGSMKEDRYALLGAIVRSVAARHYHHGPCTEEVRRLFRPPRQLEGWYETFESEDAPFTSRHFGRGAPAKERRFRPY
jgi:hypothetical protein